MGIKLIVEVLDRAPPCTSAERLVLVVLAEYANDATRECWPGMDLLTRRTGLSPSGVGAAIRRLSRRGYEVRIVVAKTSAGKPVFAYEGHQTHYRIPCFPPVDNPVDNPPVVSPQSDHTDGSREQEVSPQSPRGLTVVSERSHHSETHPLIEPSLNPQQPQNAGRAKALATIRQYTDDDDIAGIVLDLIIDERAPRNVVAYVNKIAGDGGMNEWIERAWERWAELASEAEQVYRTEFLKSLKGQGYCEHGFVGGHIRDKLGWVSCPIERKAIGDPWNF